MSSRRGGSDSFGSGGVSRKRYAAGVEKGENAWKREWSSFISGVDMKRVRDGTTSVALKAKADLAPREEDYDGDAFDSLAADIRGRNRTSDHHNHEDEDGNETGDSSATFSAAPLSFSYLFSSPAERRAERNQKRKREEDDRQRKLRENTVSKHQLALDEAQQRGLKLEGMSRKEVRDFLRLTKSKEQEAAQQKARDMKLYELMDDRIAWYQQGPHPIDLIAERLVSKKAAKKGKRQGLLKYNYLIPHPSWMAVRARRRREGVVVGLGKRFTFDEETGQAMDPLRNIPVDLTKVNLLLDAGYAIGYNRGGPTAAAVTATVDDDDETNAGGDDGSEWRNDPEEQEEENSGGAAADDNDDEDKEGKDSHARGSSGGGRREEEVEEGSDDENDTRRSKKKRSATNTKPATSKASKGTDEDKKRAVKVDRGQPQQPPPAHPAAATSLHGSMILVDPARALTTFSRAIVRNRDAAMAIQRANLTTSYLSSSLVKSPNIGLDDDDDGKGNNSGGGGGAYGRQGKKTVVKVPAKPQQPPRSRLSSFDAAPSGGGGPVFDGAYDDDDDERDRHRRHKGRRTEGGGRGRHR